MFIVYVRLIYLLVQAEYLQKCVYLIHIKLNLG